jgi:hypothetical protein
MTTTLCNHVRAALDERARTVGAPSSRDDARSET